MDPLPIELSPPRIPSFDEALEDAGTLVDYEHAWSGLSDEYERRPLTTIYTHDEYAGLERAIADERCSELLYVSDGLRVRGYVAWPPRQKSPCPVVLFARGGNRHFGSIGPLTLLDFLAVADEGYVVVGTQYRGGPGSEGADEYGGADVNDLLNLVPVARALEDVDPDTMFVWAVSRGGMMTALALRTGLTVNAIAMRAPMVDLAETAATRPDVRDVFEELMLDYAPDPEAALERRSALSWSGELRVPTLLVHGQQDMRVPLTQSQRLQEELHANGTEVELVVYARDSHLLLLHRHEYLDAVVRWFNDHAGCR